MFQDVQVAVFFLTPIVLALFSVGWIVLGSRSTVWWVIVYMILILYFPNNSFGLLERSDSANFYTRGVGVFFFSAINVMLFGLVLQAFVARRFGERLVIPHNLRLVAMLFWIVLAGNVIVGFWLRDVRWTEIFGPGGLLHAANFMFFFYVLTTCVKEPRDFDRLVNVFLFCAITRGVWGAVRYVALGGDPANYYANFQQMSVKLTFFDINDNYIAATAAFIVAWRLLRERIESLPVRAFYWFVVLLEIGVVSLSHRRTALGGLVLAALFFAWCQRARIRYALIALYFAVGIPALMVARFQRTTADTHATSLLERLLPDVVDKGQVTFTTGRFAELYAAYLSLRDSPWWGLGVWGRYDDFRFSELAWHNGEFGWMHSGVLHLALKSGLIGVAIMVAATIAFVAFAWRVRRKIPPHRMGLFAAGIAGMLFMLPNWLVGTPMIEFRTMQWMAFAFALPYMAYAVGRAEARARAAAPAEAPLPAGAVGVFGSRAAVPLSAFAIRMRRLGHGVRG